MTTLPKLPPKARRLLEHFVKTQSLPNELTRMEYNGKIAQELQQKRVSEFESLISRQSNSAYSERGILRWKPDPSGGFAEATYRETANYREMAVRISSVGSFVYTRITEVGSYVVGFNPPNPEGTSTTFALYLSREGGFLAQGRS